MGKDSFVLYKSFYRPISKLSDKQLGRLFRAIFCYQLGEVVSVEEDIEMAFEFFKNQFEIDESKYQSKVERNTENGRKGGNPNFKKGQSNPYYKREKDNQNITEDNRVVMSITEDNPINDNDNGNDNDNDLKKDISKKKSPKKEKKELDLSFVAPEFMPVFARWLDYKKKRGESYKVEWSLKACYTKLLELSGNDPIKAEAVIEQSFANNWAGIFKIKDDGNNRSNYTSKQEANQYAIDQFIAKRRAKEQGLVGEMEKPF